MKAKFFTYLIFFFTLSVSLFAQKKLVLDDRTGTIDSVTDSLLTVKLAQYKIENVSIIDFKKKCEYIFSKLSQEENSIILELFDCDDKLIGQKDLGISLQAASEAEKAFLLCFTINDIIDNPGHYTPEEIKVKPEPVVIADSSGKVGEPKNADVDASAIENHHSSRYIFNPTAYHLQKGELYYNTLYLLVHDVQYGLTDRLSLGMGTTVGLFPFYLTPKYTFYQGEKSALAVGDLMLIGTWGVSFFGNIAYATYTYGNEFNNISLSAGHFHLSGEDLNPSNRLIVNLSYMLQISDYFYFVNENYFTGFSDKVHYYDEVWVPYVDDPTNGYYEYNYDSEEFYDRNNIAFAGIAGIRFISKNKNVRAYTLGVAYLNLFFDKDLPAKYRDQNADENINMIIPMVSFTQKFGNKY